MTDRTKNTWGVVLASLAGVAGCYGLFFSGDKGEVGVSIVLIGYCFAFILQVVGRVKRTKRLTSVSKAILFICAYGLAAYSFYENLALAMRALLFVGTVLLVVAIIVLDKLNRKVSCVVGIAGVLVVLWLSVSVLLLRGRASEGVIAIIPTLYLLSDMVRRCAAASKSGAD